MMPLCRHPIFAIAAKTGRSHVAGEIVFGVGIAIGIGIETTDR
jgi:hypothetical protein